MRVTTKGQVTIPQHIREKLDIGPASEVEFIEENGRVYVVKRSDDQVSERPLRRYRGIATVRMRTDEILALTRSDE
jgi:AbrB family looped-hinge helix DNA binding protein